jgi:hypothetical protein
MVEIMNAKGTWLSELNFGICEKNHGNGRNTNTNKSGAKFITFFTKHGVEKKQKIISCGKKIKTCEETNLD